MSSAATRASFEDSWRLGAVRVTERFLSGDGPAKPKQVRELVGYVTAKLERAPWLGRCGPRLVGIGGTIRNLAAAAQRDLEVPEAGVQGYVITRDELDRLVDELAKRTPADRARFPGVKPSRGDIILGGAIVVQTVMEVGGFEGLEVTEAGLREGVFFEHHLGGEPPLFDDVRRASVVNLAAQYRMDPEHSPHTAHVAHLALGLFDELAAAGVHDGDPGERELLWAAALLHDIGMTVDYDDHHKHSRYLVLNAGLPGFEQRELALIGQAVRYHRKGMPSLGPFAPLAIKGDEERLARMSTLPAPGRGPRALTRPARARGPRRRRRRHGEPRARLRRRRPRPAMGRRPRDGALRARLRPSADGLRALGATSAVRLRWGQRSRSPSSRPQSLRRSARRGGRARPGPRAARPGR